MAQDIILNGRNYEGVEGLSVEKTDGENTVYYDVAGTTAEAGDVRLGKTIINSRGEEVEGTLDPGSGGSSAIPFVKVSPGATAVTIPDFEVESGARIYVYNDIDTDQNDSFISALNVNNTGMAPICSANAVDLMIYSVPGAAGGLKCIPAKSGALLVYDEDGVLYDGTPIPCWRIGTPGDIYTKFLAGQEDPPLEAAEVRAAYQAGGDIVLLYPLPDGRAAFLHLVGVKEFGGSSFTYFFTGIAASEDREGESAVVYYAEWTSNQNSWGRNEYNVNGWREYSNFGIVGTLVLNNDNWRAGHAVGSVRTSGSASEELSYALGAYACAEGEGTQATGQGAHSEGLRSVAQGQYAHAEGDGTTAAEAASHAEGFASAAAGYYSHAEGQYTAASGTASHTEGSATVAAESFAHAEGEATHATGQGAHSEGFASIAQGQYAHAEGYSTANGDYAHAEGYSSSAAGYYSHTEGKGTAAYRRSAHVFGEYNITDTNGSTASDRGTYVEIVGNGTDGTHRSNIRTMDWSGNMALAGSLTLGLGTADDVTITAAQLKALLDSL